MSYSGRWSKINCITYINTRVAFRLKTAVLDSSDSESSLLISFIALTAVSYTVLKAVPKIYG
jgi:hypothetical protein